MPTPPKTYLTLVSEKKSHRTKKELSSRKEQEETLATGKALRERDEVNQNAIAHKEFLRLNKLLTTIEKNDAIYEVVINRYCMMVAECCDLEKRRDELYGLIAELRATFYSVTDEMEKDEKAELLLEFSRSMEAMSRSMIACDKQIQTKRKALLEIEKENIMTIAAALRSIQKKPESKKNALLEALGGD